jgi:hypothetical protein
MSKVITFSRQFPVYHPRKGEPTFFVEKIINSLPTFDNKELVGNPDYLKFCRSFNYENTDIKYHTIRAGSKWKVGDKFSPRVWSGKPRRSKQIIIAPDIEIKKVWNIEIINSDGAGDYDKGFWVKIDNEVIADFMVNELAINDGLNIDDFHAWFNKPVFTGQIICWNNEINY